MIGLSIATLPDVLEISNQRGSKKTQIQTSKATRLPYTSGAVSVIKQLQQYVGNVLNGARGEDLVLTVGSSSPEAEADMLNKIGVASNHPPYMLAAHGGLGSFIDEVLKEQFSSAGHITRATGAFLGHSHEEEGDDGSFDRAVGDLAVSIAPTSESARLAGIAMGDIYQEGMRAFSFLNFQGNAFGRTVEHHLDSNKKDIFIQAFFERVEDPDNISITRIGENNPLLSNLTLATIGKILDERTGDSPTFLEFVKPDNSSF